MGERKGESRDIKIKYIFPEALSLHSHISFIPLSLFPFLYLGDGIEAKGEEER